MKQILLLIIVGVVFSESCAFGANHQTDTSSRHILIVNAFDMSDSKARKNKKELFTELADSLKGYVYNYMSEVNKQKITILPEVLRDTSLQNIQAIMDQYKATVVVIMDLDVYFNQTDVEVTRNSDGSKSREASYDICCFVKYNIYRPGIKAVSSEQRDCEFFTKRGVTSGLLAAGPDVVGKKKYTYDMVKKNARRFVYRSQLNN